MEEKRNYNPETRDLIISQSNIKVIDKITEQKATDLLIIIRNEKKKILDFIESYTKPLEREKKVWFSLRDKLLNPLLEIENNLNQQLVTFHEEQLRITREYEEKLRQEQMNNSPIPETVIPYVAPPEKPDGITYTKTWKAKIIDSKTIPCEYNGYIIRPVDMSVLNKIARETQGTAQIDGVEFYEEFNTRIK